MGRLKKRRKALMRKKKGLTRRQRIRWAKMWGEMETEEKKFMEQIRERVLNRPARI